MALTIEDGTGIEGANSFVAVSELRTFATARGVSLPAADADVEVLLIQAMDYLTGMDSRFVGDRADEQQDLPWPRVSSPSGQWWEGIVPQQVKRAQMQLAIHANAGPLVRAERPGERGTVVEQTVGPLTTKYAPGAANSQPSFPDVDDSLRSLFRGRGSVIAHRG